MEEVVLSRSNNVYSKGMYDTFVSEAAVDEVGPRKKFFRLVLDEIESMFDSELSQHIVKHNLIELQTNLYLIVGRIIALSLMYGGPASQLFCRSVTEYFLDITPYTVAVEDVQHSSSVATSM